MNTLKQMCSWLLHLAEVEIKAETIRQLLSENTNYHPYLLFKYLKHDAQGIQEFLLDQGFQHSLDQCNAYIDAYDQSSKGHHLYSEFLRVVLPLDNNYLREKITQKQPINCIIDQDILYTFAKLVNHEIISQEKSSFYIQDIENNQDYSPMKLFKIIDQLNCSKLTVQDFQHIFNIVGVVVYNNELISFFRRLDLLNDGVINEYEFRKALTKRLHVSNSPQTPQKSYLQKHINKNLNKTLDKKISSTKKRMSKSSSLNRIHSKEKPKLLNESLNNTVKIPNKYKEQKTKLRAQMELQKVLKQNNKNKRSSSTKKQYKQQDQKQNNTDQKALFFKQDDKQRVQFDPKHVLNEFTDKKQIIHNDYSKFQQSTEKKQFSDKKQYRDQSEERENQIEKKIQYAVSKEQQQGRSIFFFEILKQIIKSLKDIELLKIQLATIPQFNYCDVFRQLDDKKQGYLTIDSFRRYIPISSIKSLIKQYRGRVKFTDFLQLIQPYNEDYAQYLDKKEAQNLREPLRGDTGRIFGQLLQQLSQFEDYMQITRNRIHKTTTLKGLYQMMTQSNHICLKDIDQFCFSHKYEPEISEIDLLFHKLDQDKDGKISFSDFCANFAL